MVTLATNHNFFLILLLNVALGVNSYTNVNGDALQKCSSNGMALTGYTRTGYCVDRHDDAGSHHICIDMSSTEGGNFCSVTGQSNWCSSHMGCDGLGGQCPVKNWCVCEWAFASYIEAAGGCDKIQDIVCDAINSKVVEAYTSRKDEAKYSNALNCIVDRCDIDLTLYDTAKAV